MTFLVMLTTAFYWFIWFVVAGFAITLGIWLAESMRERHSSGKSVVSFGDFFRALTGKKKEATEVA